MCCRRSTIHPKKSQRDATDRESPKPRRRNVAKRILSKNRIQVQRRRKAKPRLRKNCGQRSSCRTADSCVNLNKSYLSMYHKLFFLCEKHVHSEHVFIWFVTNIFFIFRACSCFLVFIFNASTEQTFNLYRPDAQSIYLSTRAIWVCIISCFSCVKSIFIQSTFSLDLSRIFFHFRACSCFLPFIFNAYTDQTLNLSIYLSIYINTTI